MLIDRLREGIRLIGAATVTGDDEAAVKGMGDEILRPQRGGGRQRSAPGPSDVPAWMSPSLVLATARTTSGM